MKRIVAAVIAASLLLVSVEIVDRTTIAPIPIRTISARIGAALAWAYSGVCGIWYQNSTTQIYTAGNAAGTTVGRDLAYTNSGSDGVVQMGPGGQNLGFGTIPVGVVVIRGGYQGWDLAGRPFRYFDRFGNQVAQMDSAGENVYAHTVVRDSLRVPQLQVGGAPLTKILHGTFTLNVATTIQPGTTLDAIQVFSPGVGLNSSSQWDVLVGPVGSSLPSGVSIGYAWVSSNEAITIRFSDGCNASSATLGSRTYWYLAIRQ